MYNHCAVLSHHDIPWPCVLVHHQLNSMLEIQYQQLSKFLKKGGATKGPRLFCMSSHHFTWMQLYSTGFKWIQRIGMFLNRFDGSHYQKSNQLSRSILFPVNFCMLWSYSNSKTLDSSQSMMLAWKHLTH